MSAAVETMEVFITLHERETMNTKTARALSVATIALLAGIGVAGCSASSDSPNGNSSQSKPAEETKKVHTKADVAETVEGVFASISEETNDFLIKAMREGVDPSTLTQQEALELYKENFPKTLAYMSDDMDEDRAAKFAAAFSASYSGVPGLEIRVREEGIELDGDTAKVSGTSFELWVYDELQFADGNESTAGNFDLKYEDGKWVIDDFFIGEGYEDI